MDAKLSEKGMSCLFCGGFFILWKGKFYEYFSFFAFGTCLTCMQISIKLSLLF